MNEEKYIVPNAVLNEKPDGYEFKAELPGIGKEDAELHLDGRTLTLKTHAKYQNPAGFKQVIAEFDRPNYAMSIDLPEMADANGIAARIENGILTVKIGKRAETQARRIDIA